MPKISNARVSLVIRTLNEERYLEELLLAVRDQKIDREVEIVIVDSGSTDRTLEIAVRYECTVVGISKEEFTFGRSLNFGCEVASGSILVFISGHCIPASPNWLANLIKPLDGISCSYVYGRQLGRDTTCISEKNIFEKFYPRKSMIPQDGFFCNNANSAILHMTWKQYRFDESLTGCEDMELARRLVSDGRAVGYVADAPVFHIHNENWRQIAWRFERESLALRSIMPELQLSLKTAVWYFLVAVYTDFFRAPFNSWSLNNLTSVCSYRSAQFFGSYNGNHQSRKLSVKMRQRYFYPRHSFVQPRGPQNDE